MCVRVCVRVCMCVYANQLVLNRNDGMGEFALAAAGPSGIAFENIMAYRHWVFATLICSLFGWCCVEMFIQSLSFLPSLASCV